MDEQTTWNIEFQWTQITNQTTISNDDQLANISLITPITTTDILSFEYMSSSSLSIPAFQLQDDTSYLFYIHASNGGDFSDPNTTASAHVILSAFDIPSKKAVSQNTISISSSVTVAVSDLFEFPRGSPPDNDHYR